MRRIVLLLTIAICGYPQVIRIDTPMAPAGWAYSERALLKESTDAAVEFAARYTDSRGHFRAVFSVYFAPEQIIECDAPGLTSPNLANFDWQGFSRPVYPLDAHTPWSPPG